MAILIPIVLGNTATSITRVMSLYNYTPVFPGYFDVYGNPQIYTGAQLNRVATPSFGYPHSIDGTNQYLVPQNSYTLASASQISGNSTDSTALNVLLVDVETTPIEPGFSRLRVDYQDSNNNPQTQYFDFPFYEIWDVHPTEIQAIVDYITGAVNFYQTVLHKLERETDFLIQRMFPIGLHVSGDVSVSQATQNLETSLEAHSITNLDQLTNYTLKSDIYSKYFTSEIYYPGSTITIPLSASNIFPNDTIAIFGKPLKTTRSGNNLSAVLPVNIPYTLTAPITITNNGLVKNGPYFITIKIKPTISSFQTSTGQSLGFPGDIFVINGSNFGPSKGTITFSNSLSATIVEWNDNFVTGLIPELAHSGNVILETSNGFTTKFGVTIGYPNSNGIFVISPDLAVATTGETIQFSGTLNGVSTSSILWSIIDDNQNYGNGNITVGTINSNGLYTAPTFVSSPLPLAISATIKTQYGYLTAQTSLLILPTSNTFTISPSAASVQIGFNNQFQLFNESELINDVQWYVNGVIGGNSTYGFIAFNGFYTAPTVTPATNTIYITGLGTLDNGTQSAAHAIVKIVSSAATANSKDITNNLINSAMSMLETKQVFSKDGPYTGQVLIPNETVTGAFSYPDESNPPQFVYGPYNIAGSFSYSCATTADGEGNIDCTWSYTAPNFNNTDQVVLQVQDTNSGGTIGSVDETFVTMAPNPTITNVQSGCPGQNITINGNNFTSDAEVLTSDGMYNFPIITNNYTSLVVMIPSSITSPGTYNLVVSTDSGTSNSYGLVIPNSCFTSTLPVLTSIASCCPGQQTTLTGQYFTSDMTVYFVGTNENIPIVPGSFQTTDSINYTVNVDIPSDVPSSGGTYYVYALNSAGTSNNTAFVVPSSCAPVASPTFIINGPSTVCSASSNNYTALYNGTDVTNLATWSATSGYIQNGVYEAPQTINVNYQITASYNGLSTTVNVMTQNCTLPTPPSPPTTCNDLLVQPSTQTISLPFGTQQFIAYLNGEETTADSWLVNGVLGGNSTFGTIDDTGFYTAPGLSPGFANVKITALKNYDSAELSGYAIATLYATVPQTATCNVMVVSQINVFFGDTRRGYLPVGTSIALAPGQYWIAQYQEILNKYKAAIPNGGSQLLSQFAAYAESSNIATQMYNQGELIDNGDGTYTRPFSILIGICDPITGYFQSEWDIKPLAYPINNPYPAQPVCGHGLFTDASKSIDVKTYLKNKLTLDKKKPKTAFNIDDVTSRNNIFWTGKAIYNNNEIKFTESLKLIDLNDNDSKIMADSGTSISIQDNNYLICVPTSSGTMALLTIPENDKLFDSSHTCVIGLVKENRFISLLSSFQVKNEATEKFAAQLPKSKGFRRALKYLKGKAV